MILLTFLLLAVPSFAQDYVIDKVDEIIHRTCEDCPPFVGEAFITTPGQVSKKYPKEKIQVFGCHFSLIEKNKVLLASHCARSWTSLEWQELSQGDCGKVAGFYFPKTAQFPEEKARCRKFISPIYLLSGVKQLEPDHLIIELDREVHRPTTQLQKKDLEADTPYFIWGYDGATETYTKRTCWTLPGPSVFTPLSLNSSGSYQTVTCDGDLEQGWSGASLLDSQNHVVGLVSFGVDQSGYDLSQFGKNEVSVSLSKCISESESSPSCYTNESLLYDYLVQIYLAGVDQGLHWQTSTISMLEKTFAGIKFEYHQYRKDPADLFYKPSFKAKCIQRDVYKEKSEVVLYAVGSLESMKAKFFTFNEDTTVKGILEKPQNGLGGSFILMFDFIKGSHDAVPDCPAANL